MNVELSQDDVQNIINSYDKDIKKMKQQEKEINRLNNIINQIKEYLKYQLENLDFEKDTKAKMLGSMILVMLDKEGLKEDE